ncbi:hypothetical protein EXIGLDRAFT_845539 [Exidia glandulosa HHB12029]|uniref:Uncharacterized protein n=1 Tax=Exidia glandulosa HHB12029 TaxID=1314781 RepID=A0A165BDT7_EXIGL|nr:hypothetical protein EXIGLDRAFT_845539 [Exidia glandulosa HHB12029]
MCPEGGELIASYEYIVHVLLCLAFWRRKDERPDHTFAPSICGWVLRAIWADLTRAERDRRISLGTASQRAIDYLPEIVEPLTSLPRGNAHDRGSVWPPQFPTLDGFVFRNVHYSPRSLILDFTVCALNMHYLTHTSIIIYPKDVWYERVVDVPSLSTERAFKIIIALEFDDYVIAFLTKDLIAKPEWVLDIPVPGPDPFPGFNTNLASLPVPTPYWALFAVNLIETVLDSPRRGVRALAVVALRHDFPECAPGVGQFTICELFYKAGIWTGITLREFVLSPSLVARFVEAIYEYYLQGKDKYGPKVVIPTLHNGRRWICAHTFNANIIMSPSKEQRVNFTEEFLDVWAKDTVRVHPRHAALITAYTDWIEDGDLDAPPPPDPFEPSLIQNALRKSQNLAHLIFGTPCPGEPDPITAMYMKKAPHLLKKRPNLVSYSPRFYPQPRDDKAKAALIDMYVYNFDADSAGAVWSVLPPDPRRFSVHPPEVRAHSLGTYIINNTNDVSIGPLEYAGLSEPVAVAGGKLIATTIKSMRAEVRAELKLRCDANGLSHVKLSMEDKALIDAGMREKMAANGLEKHADLLARYNRKYLGSAEDEENAPVLTPVQPEKRKRKSADQHLASSSSSIASPIMSALQDVSNTARRSVRRKL